MGEMKRIAAPGFWKISRKASKYTICPMPGPHGKRECIPIGVLLRDYLKIAENLSEVKKLLNSKTVSVNSRIVLEYKFPVGLMDIVSIKDAFYRIVPKKNGLYPKEISDSSTRLCKIIGKKYVKGGAVQLNMLGGENMVIKKEDDSFKTGDVMALDIKKGKVSTVLKLEKGAMVLITGGRNMGDIGIVESIEVIKNPLPTLVTLRLGEKSVKVPKDYVFVVGEKEPVIQV